MTRYLPFFLLDKRLLTGEEHFMHVVSAEVSVCVWYRDYQQNFS